MGKKLTDLPAGSAATSASVFESVESGVSKTYTAAQIAVAGAKKRERLSVFDFMTAIQVIDVMARTALVDVTGALVAALAYQDTAIIGSFELYFPDGTYLVSGSGDRILEVQAGTKLIGASLEGTRIKVDPASTAAAVIEDNGSAAKTEIYNLTIDINSNANVTSGVRLGQRAVQFGTYGGMDNVMVRDGAHAACIGFDLNCNIIVLGRLYTSSVANGLIHDEGGVGMHVESFCPIEFYGTGLQLALGDSVNFLECEAPSSDDAKPIVLARGGKVDNFILAIQSGRKVKTAIEIDPIAVDDFEIARTELIFAGTGFYGDSASPADSGTATAGSATTLTDTTKTWTRNQWKGGALYITGGTGVDEHIRIAGNTKDTITFIGDIGTPPDATSTYALDYLIKLVGGGGYATSDSGTVFDTTTETLSVTDTATTDKLVVGKSNHSLPLQGLMKVVDTHDFASVAAGAVSAARSVTVQGAQAGMPVLIGIGDTLRATGAQVVGSVSAANTVHYYLVNPTGVAIDAASQSYVVVVLDYA